MKLLAALLSAVGLIGSMPPEIADAPPAPLRRADPHRERHDRARAASKPRRFVWAATDRGGKPLICNGETYPGQRWNPARTDRGLSRAEKKAARRARTRERIAQAERRARDLAAWSAP